MGMRSSLPFAHAPGMRPISRQALQAGFVVAGAVSKLVEEGDNSRVVLLRQQRQQFLAHFVPLQAER